MKSRHEIVADFDGIADALAQGPPRDRLTPAERALMRHVPPGARTALDVGCGDGVITRALAAAGLRVTAIDISPRMVALARARTHGEQGIDYRVGDFMVEPFPDRSFDVVVSINVLHHLAFDAALSRLARVVAPGGTLLLQDVVTRGGVRYLLTDIAAGIGRHWRRLTDPHHPSRAVERLYARHGHAETYLTPVDAEAAFQASLPGARVVHHVEWRYSVVWSAAGALPDPRARTRGVRR